MAGDNCTIIDVGGQDTKVIIVKDGMVQDFLTVSYTHLDVYKRQVIYMS